MSTPTTSPQQTPPTTKTGAAQPSNVAQPASAPEPRYVATWMGPVEMDYNRTTGQYEAPNPADYDPRR